MKIFKPYQIRVISSLLMISILFSSCRMYHIKSRTILHNNAEQIIKNKIFPHILIHSGNVYWELKNIQIKDDFLTGDLIAVDERVDFYYKYALIKSNYKVTKSETYYNNQLHFYLDSFEYDGQKAIINYTQIKEIKVLDKNTGLSTILNLGITGATVTAAFFTFLVIACNCPHNYIYDGEKYIFNNTLFTGATAPNLERDDFKPLPDYKPDNSNYNILIKNEENEIQYTNLLEIIQVNHSKNSEVALDQKGNVYTLNKREKPIKVLDDFGNNLSYKLNEINDETFSFDQIGKDNFSHVYATFKVNESNEFGKIIIRAKNSDWGGLVYHSFVDLLGKNYNKWVKHNMKRTPEKAHEDIVKSGIPLIIDIKQNGQWQTIETIDLIGEVNFNEIIIPVSKKFCSDSTLEIRITSGYKFWELDALQMDFSTPESINIEKLQPKSALGTDDFTDDLLRNDKQYMKHSIIGDSALIKFENLSTSSENRTLFLHSKGFYTSKEIHEGSTNWKAIMAMIQNGGFSLFSKELYESYKNVTFSGN